ncbi:OLC1v1037121C1 [Oldenlandia corymbosa var. corymbosa]|uniref:OLC1v1037121C1 n=1 Tax=Oldenlandia corymbosa var. corymbosa TaxID=529605 RepID=A0AAV1CX07_OLDCO|nr:OLC1v1037121C1 [Oldenlandia corymbosa var. corymbosa]
MLQFLKRGVDILVATPVGLVDMIKRSCVSLRNVKFLAVDETDLMLDMGFEPQLRRIHQQMEMPRGCQADSAFSAQHSLQKYRLKLASEFLSNHVFLAARKIQSRAGHIAEKAVPTKKSDGTERKGYVGTTTMVFEHLGNLYVTVDSRATLEDNYSGVMRVRDYGRKVVVIHDTLLVTICGPLDYAATLVHRLCRRCRRQFAEDGREVSAYEALEMLLQLRDQSPSTNWSQMTDLI